LKVAGFATPAEDTASAARALRRRIEDRLRKFSTTTV
jgi:hypothetical protein